MLPPHAPDMLAVRIQAIDGTGTFTLSDSQPCRLLLSVNGSLHMAPPFPRSGPGESSSPMSQVVLRCYDFPSRLSGRLFVSLPGSTPPSSIRVSQLALALPEGRRSLPGQGQCSTGDPIAGLLSRGRERDLPGAQAVHPVPLPRSRTPAESTIPHLFVGLVDAAPASQTAKASACQLFRGYRAASAPAAYASRMAFSTSNLSICATKKSSLSPAGSG